MPAYERSSDESIAVGTITSHREWKWSRRVVRDGLLSLRPVILCPLVWGALAWIPEWKVRSSDRQPTLGVVGVVGVRESTREGSRSKADGVSEQSHRGRNGYKLIQLGRIVASCHNSSQTYSSLLAVWEINCDLNANTSSSLRFRSRLGSHASSAVVFQVGE